MNGFEFRERQKQDPRIASIPVVVITADGDAMEKSRQIAASSVIRKPIDLDALVGAVKDCVGPDPA